MFSDSLSTPPSLPFKPQPALASNNHQFISPAISISVVDADNFNVCMCNLMDEQNNQEVVECDKICKICRNLIKRQPSERCTLVSKRVMLGDVVVSRIDTQYLSSNYPNLPSQIRRLQDPYTPESIESPSPQPELDEKEFPIINKTADCEEIREILCKHKPIEADQANGETLKESLEENIACLQTHYNMTHTVSPSQLTTRLEILRRESHLVVNECGSKSGSGSGADVDDIKSLNKSKCCFRCSCVIL